MRIQNKNNNFNQSQVVYLKDDKWLADQKIAGRCVAQALKDCSEVIKNGSSNVSLLDLEQLVLKRMKVFNCTPTFLNYKGFPGACCISVNHQLVHGIPNDYILKDGDLVSVDIGATFNGSIADAARTWIYGKPKNLEHVRMLSVCWNALKNAIKAVKVSLPIGIIGHTIHNTVKNSGFNLITSYGGHAIKDAVNGKAVPHAWPFIANKSLPTEGIHMQNGFLFAIEPMVVLGDPTTKILIDGWTVETGGIGCHFEDTIFICNNQIHTLTEIIYENY